jgi:hypothetical protein
VFDMELFLMLCAVIAGAAIGAMVAQIIEENL